jgi:hypothetical protein
MTINLADVVDPTNVAMTYLPSHSYFTMKTGQRRSILNEGLRKKFQRDWLSELQIIGSIDLTHAAFAEQTNDAIACSNHRPRQESTLVNRIKR